MIGRLLIPAQLALERFFRQEASSGILLILASALAIVWANSGFSSLYHAMLHTPFLTETGYPQTVHFWINHGLMAIFFLFVGMEIKREMVEGELSSRQQAMLPFVAAAGGMLLPGLIYTAVNWHGENTLRGWAIPTATDIAFALGILSLFGSRVPLGLKVFLTAVAVIDDLGAVLIIAFFYSSGILFPALGAATACLLGLYALSRIGTRRIWPYLALGCVLWGAILASGIHATVAGVLLGFMIPLQSQQGEAPMLHRLIAALHPWVAYLIVPLFAFANAGLDFRQLSADTVTHNVPMGIALGLFFGKQAGIFGASALMIKSGLGRLPEGVSWCSFYGACLLGGIGFTMSLFIAGLAFTGDDMANETRLGVLLGSACSAAMGALWLHYTLPRRLETEANSGG